MTIAFAILVSLRSFMSTNTVARPGRASVERASVRATIRVIRTCTPSLKRACARVRRAHWRALWQVQPGGQGGRGRGRHGELRPLRGGGGRPRGGENAGGRVGGGGAGGAGGGAAPGGRVGRGGAGGNRGWAADGGRAPAGVSVRPARVRNLARRAARGGKFSGSPSGCSMRVSSRRPSRSTMRTQAGQARGKTASRLGSR